MKIIWSQHAQLSYLEILEEVYEKWNFETVSRFETEITELIERILNYNHICPKSKIVHLHRCVVNRHISLIYRKVDNIIEIITLVFNQSNHSF